MTWAQKVMFSIGIWMLVHSTGSRPQNRVSRDYVRRLAAKYWPMGEVDNAVRIAVMESGLDANALNATAKERSKGLWQLNVASKTEIPWPYPWRHAPLFDPDTNAHLAYQLWKLEGWSPWTTARNL